MQSHLPDYTQGTLYIPNLQSPRVPSWPPTSSNTLALHPCYIFLQVLDGLLREQLLDLLVRLEEVERRLHEAVEQEGEVDQQREAEDLQPLERLPAEPQRHDPDEERPARVDGRPRRGADGARDGEAEEVETAA